jgi:TGS domain
MKEPGTLMERKEHWNRVATRLDGLYHNAALTKAGLWHGDPNIHAENKLENEALAIIARWRQIRIQIRQGDPLVLATHLEKWHADKLPLILFIVEKFDHYVQNYEVRDILTNWRRCSRLPDVQVLLRIKEAVLAETTRNANPVDERLRFKFYAEIAEGLGLMAHRDAFYWLDFLINDQGFVEEDLAGLQHLVDSVFIPQLASFTAQVSQRVQSEKPAYWEWHRLDQVLRTIRGKVRKVAKLPISYFGHVVVKLPEPGLCYQALGTLCASFPHRAEIYDAISIPAPTSIRSIDLTLLLADDEDGKHVLQPVAVSICLREPDVPYWKKVLEQGGTRVANAEVAVFTKDGEVKRVAMPARLVDFAFIIHLDFIAYFDHALINDRREDNLLALLRHGDKVELVKGKKFRWPPPEWLGGLVRSVRDYVKARLKPLLLRKALQFFCTHYLAINDAENMSKSESNIAKEDIDKVFREFVAINKGREVAERLGSRANRGRLVFAEQFLMCIVFTHKNELDWPYPYKAAISEKVIKQVAKELRAITSVKGEISALRTRGGNLKIEYYVMVGMDRAGLAFDLLQVFHQQRASILEVVARVSFEGNAFVRITTVEVPYQKRERILAMLQQQMNGGAIRRLDENSLPWEQEAPLPQRMTLHNVEYVDAIPTNRPVSESYLFYGRERNVSQMFAVIARSAAPHAHTGGLILIKGPLKVGKTSLALHVVDKVKHGYGGTGGKALPRLMVFIRLGPGATIEDIQRKIIKEVEPNWQRFAAACVAGPPEPLPSDLASLFDFLKAVRGKNRGMRPIVIIFIDEVMELFAPDNQAKAQNEIQFLAFSDFFEMIPGAVLMIAGPQYPFNRSSIRMKNKFDSFETISLRGLDAKASAALVNREKLHNQGRLPVKIAQVLCERLFIETGGNPWWLANMTNQLRDSDSGLLEQFSDTAWEHFVLDFIAQHDLFSDRFLHKAPPNLHMAFAAFKKVVVTQIQAGKTLDLSPEELCQVDENVSRDEAVELLKAQLDIGGLAFDENGRYRCSAPILEKWLREAVLSGRYCLA